MNCNVPKMFISRNTVSQNLPNDRIISEVELNNNAVLIRAQLFKVNNVVS